MKLRNKKTGEIADLAGKGLLKSERSGNHIIVYPEGALNYYAYISLAKFNEDWEDYKPTEPLIKDEKVRKAVRAWADANKFDHLIYWSKRDETYFSFMDGKTELEIMFNNPYGIIGLKNDRNYTIIELCGEEES